MCGPAMPASFKMPMEMLSRVNRNLASESTRFNAIGLGGAGIGGALRGVAVECGVKGGAG